VPKLPLTELSAEDFVLPFTSERTDRVRSPERQIHRDRGPKRVPNQMGAFDQGFEVVKMRFTFELARPASG
jgi:hypothetical protein